VPLFPKNPELPTPGVAASKTATPAVPAKPVVAPGAGEGPKKKGSKTPGKKTVLFSKKTVASMHVKVGIPQNPLVQAATDALKAALLKKDAKTPLPAKGAKTAALPVKAVAKAKPVVAKPSPKPAKGQKKPAHPAKKPAPVSRPKPKK